MKTIRRSGRSANTPPPVMLSRSWPPVRMAIPSNIREYAPTCHSEPKAKNLRLKLRSFPSRHQGKRRKFLKMGILAKK